jgi:hypothetical protein
MFKLAAAQSKAKARSRTESKIQSVDGLVETSSAVENRQQATRPGKDGAPTYLPVLLQQKLEVAVVKL